MGETREGTRTHKFSRRKIIHSITTSVVFFLHFLFYRVGEDREMGMKGCLEEERQLRWLRLFILCILCLVVVVTWWKYVEAFYGGRDLLRNPMRFMAIMAVLEVVARGC